MSKSFFRHSIAASIYKYVEMKEYDTKIFTKKFCVVYFWNTICKFFPSWDIFCIDFEAFLCYDKEEIKNIQKE